MLQITDGTGTVEELPLELRGNGIPAHEHGFTQELQNLLFFLNKGSTIVVIFSPLNRLIDIARQRGIGELIGEVMRENEPMLQMCQELGFLIAPQLADPAIMLVRRTLTGDRAD